MIRAGILVFLAALLGPGGFAQPAPAWQSIFDGKTLNGWKETAFRGHGTVTIESGALILAPGAPMSGVNWTGAFPKTGYEVRFEAARLQGSDFFASLTFPVGDSFCTLVLGGWGGDIVGLSSIDGGTHPITKRDRTSL